jgi:hypothetical protein
VRSPGGVAFAHNIRAAGTTGGLCYVVSAPIPVIYYANYTAKNSHYHWTVNVTDLTPPIT